MNKVNYQVKLDEIINEITRDQTVPKLLLHSCCAPCSSYVLEYLSEYFDITDFYYNPNISPREEYEYRTRELERLIREMPVKHPVKFLEGSYDEHVFFDAVRGLEEEPEGGKRCQVCFRLRLTEAARMARELNADYFTTTLSISPLKDSQLLNRLGQEIGQAYGVKYLPSDFKKRGGYLRSTELSKQYDLYRQDYCGCVFSKAERERQKAEQEKKTKCNEKCLSK